MLNHIRQRRAAAFSLAAMLALAAALSFAAFSGAAHPGAACAAEPSLPSLQEGPAGALAAESADVYELGALDQPPSYLPADFKGQLASSGILKGWGDYLYYLPEAPSDGNGAHFAFNVFERYNVRTDEWEVLPGLPMRLVYCSAALYSGNLVVAGVEYDTANGEPTTTERVYMYDTDCDSWFELDATGVRLGAAIVNFYGQLVLVGGADENWRVVGDVMEYDTASGLGQRMATLATPAFCPQLAVYKGRIYAYSYGASYGEFSGTDVAEQVLQVIEDGQVESLWNAFPRFLEPSLPDGMPSRSALFGSLVAATEGLMLVGPVSADGATDTFISSWNGDGRFVPYYKRASTSQLFGAAACLHGKRFYAAAESEDESGHVVFRATESLLAPMVLSGDNQVWRKGSDEALVISYTPDYSRYFDEVVIDDAEKPLGGDAYESEMGSTRITLQPEYLETLATGGHVETVSFDGGGGQATAHFTVEDPATPMPDPGGGGDGRGSSGGGAAPGLAGYTRPASLALTGDAMLAVPFAVLGAGAVCLGIYLARRKSRRR